MNCSEFREMLDLFIDGELDAKQRAEFEAHAAQCEPCREQMTAAEQLREILSQMDDHIAVPLPTQAAWRSAVRKDAARRRMKRIYSAVGAVAAACVLTIGVTTMLRTDNVGMPALDETAARQVAYVETDGLSDSAVLETSAAPMLARSVNIDASGLQRRIFVEDVQTAKDYLMDVIAEYGGVLEAENGNVFSVCIPSENAEEFVSTVDHIGSAEDVEFEYDRSAEIVRVCVVFEAE